MNHILEKQADGWKPGHPFAGGRERGTRVQRGKREKDRQPDDGCADDRSPTGKDGDRCGSDPCGGKQPVINVEMIM